MKLQVGSDCSNLRERLRQRLFTFTFSYSRPTGLFLSGALGGVRQAESRCEWPVGVCSAQERHPLQLEMTGPSLESLNQELELSVWGAHGKTSSEKL